MLSELIQKLKEIYKESDRVVYTCNSYGDWTPNVDVRLPDKLTIVIQGK